MKEGSLLNNQYIGIRNAGFFHSGSLRVGWVPTSSIIHAGQLRVALVRGWTFFGVESLPWQTRGDLVVKSHKTFTDVMIDGV